jgi:hypothetical protein
MINVIAIRPSAAPKQGVGGEVFVGAGDAFGAGVGTHVGATAVA